MNKGIVLLLVLLLSVSQVFGFVVLNDYDPKPAEGGKFVTVWLNVNNPTNDGITDVAVEVQPRDGLLLAPGEQSTKNVGIIGKNGFSIVQFRLQVTDDAIEGQNKLVAILSKRVEGSSQLEVSEHDIFIDVEEKDFDRVELQIGDIESDPSRVKPEDEDVRLDVILQNIGDTSAQAVQAVLSDLPEGVTFPDSYSNTALLGNIAEDGTGVATYYIDVDKLAQAGHHTAKLDVTYKYRPEADEDDYVVEQVSMPITIDIKAIPVYEILNVSYSSEPLQAGASGVQMLITLQNIGEEEAESVRIKAYGKTQQPFTFDTTSDFVAPSLKPGEIGQATLLLDIDADAPLQTYYVDLEIKSVVQDDVLLTREKAPLEITLPRPNGSWKIAVVGIVVLIIAAVVIVLRSRPAPKKTRKVKDPFKGSYLDKKEKD